MKELTQEDINRSIVNDIQPAVEKGATILGKAKPDPNIVTKVFKKLLSFVWSLICFPLLPVINMWRKA